MPDHLMPDGLAVTPVRQAEPLRLITCGSVDDGKSTLIGRLLNDTGNVHEDHRAALAATDGTVDYSRLLDGLSAEREQGITIDVAYRTLTTPRRRLLIADTPGHEQFTRNMATAASDAELAILLVDARKGLREQTRRHASIAALMGVRHVVLAVNKMDLVDWSATVFRDIADAFASHADKLGFVDIHAVPVAATSGASITRREPALSWYTGPLLLDHLETVDVRRAQAGPFRLPVQLVLRHGGDFRGYAGTVRGGSVAVGDRVQVFPGGAQTTVARIASFDGDLARADDGTAVTLVLADEVEAGRGSVIADPAAQPVRAERAKVRLVWFSPTPAQAGGQLLVRTGVDLVPARLARVLSRRGLDDLVDRSADTLAANDIGTAELVFQRPLPLDPYEQNRATGALLLIDRASNETVAAGMVLEPEAQPALTAPQFATTAARRAAQKGQRPAVLWLTGLSGAGKSTIADRIETDLMALGHHSFVLDGDSVRGGLNRDLGFSAEDRAENIRRLAEMARLMAQAGLIVAVAAISPFAEDRARARQIVGDIDFLEIHVATPIEICEARDPKGLYARARSGSLRNMTGIGSDYEAPLAPELRVLPTQSPGEASAAVLAALRSRGVLPEGGLFSDGGGV